jgi:hypothetical protein
MFRAALLMVAGALGSAPLLAASEKTLPPDKVALQPILEAWNARERRFAALNIVWSQSLPTVWQCTDASASEDRVDCRAEMHDQTIRYAPARVPVYSPLSATYRTGSTTDADFAAAMDSHFRINHLPESPPVFFERYFSDGECLDRFASSEKRQAQVVRNPSLGVLDSDLTSPVAEWLHPLLLAFRPAQFRLQVIGTKRSQILTEGAQVAGRDCVRLLEHNEASDCEIELWLERRRGFSVRRAFFRTRGELNEQIDLHYRDDDRSDPVPDSWHILSRSKRGPNAQLFPRVQKLIETTVGQLSDLRENEGNIKEFKPNLEAGTVLVDRVAGGTYRIATDGSRQRISASELTASRSGLGYRELLSIVAIGLLTSYLFVRNRNSISRLIWRSRS